MRWCSVLCATKSLKASAVVAKPPGTDTPRPESSPIISPSEEFLPPTWARPERRRSCSHRMLLLGACSLKAGNSEGFGLFQQPRPVVGACMPDLRPVYYVSDGTGITAETIGHSLLTPFADVRFVTDRIPFVDAAEKAHAAAAEI